MGGALIVSTSFNVIPAQAGPEQFARLDSRLRGNNGFEAAQSYSYPNASTYGRRISIKGASCDS
jgi:hypothetical protein